MSIIMHAYNDDYGLSIVRWIIMHAYNDYGLSLIMLIITHACNDDYEYVDSYECM